MVRAVRPGQPGRHPLLAAVRGVPARHRLPGPRRLQPLPLGWSDGDRPGGARHAAGARPRRDGRHPRGLLPRRLRRRLQPHHGDVPGPPGPDLHPAPAGGLRHVAERRRDRRRPGRRAARRATRRAAPPWRSGTSRSSRWPTPAASRAATSSRARSCPTSSARSASTSASASHRRSCVVAGVSLPRPRPAAAGRGLGPDHQREPLGTHAAALGGGRPHRGDRLPDDRHQPRDRRAPARIASDAPRRRWRPRRRDERARLQGRDRGGRGLRAHGRRPARRRARDRPRHRRRRRPPSRARRDHRASSASPARARRRRRWRCSGVARPGTRIAAGRVSIDDIDVLSLPESRRRGLRGKPHRLRPAESGDRARVRASGSAGSSTRSSTSTCRATRSARARSPRAPHGPAPGRRRVPAPVSARALAAGSSSAWHRDGPRLRAGRGRHGRADDRPRRDDAGAPARRDPRSRGAAQHGDRLRQPRPRASCATSPIASIVLYGGRIVEDAPTDELFREPRHPYTRRLLEAIPRVDAGRSLPRGIPGSAVEPWNRPSGCVFAARCELVIDACRQALPPLEAAPGGASAACASPTALALRPSGGASSRGLAGGLRQPTCCCPSTRSSRATARSSRVDNVSLAVRRGHCLGIVGESGSGKSTLLRCVAGLHERQEGTVALNGAPLAASSRGRSTAQRRGIALVPQNPDASLNPAPARQRDRRAAAQAVPRSRPLGTGRARPASCWTWCASGRRSPIACRASSAAARSSASRSPVAWPPAPSCCSATRSRRRWTSPCRRASSTLLDDLRRELGTTLLFVSHDLAVVRSLSDDGRRHARGRRPRGRRRRDRCSTTRRIRTPASCSRPFRGCSPSTIRPEAVG